MQTFGKKLSKILFERDIKQQDFADKIGVSRQTLNNSLKGRTEVDDTLIKMAYALDMTVDELIFGTNLSVNDTISKKYNPLAETNNQNTMNDPNVMYNHTPSIAENLTQALLTFAKNDQIRAKNEQTLIENNEKLMELHKKTLDLLTEKLKE